MVLLFIAFFNNILMYTQVEESQTLLINQQSLLRQKEKKQVYKFGFGQSPFLPPREVMEALRTHAHHKEYTSVQGDLELRDRISKFHKEINDIDSNPESIMIAPGSKSLLYTLLASFEPLDFLIPEPSWVSYAPQGQLIGHHNIRIKSSFENRWRVTPSALEEALSRKKHKHSILILNYPGNPDGLSYTEEELVMISEMARKNEIFVISDEIYALLSFGTHHSFANYYPERTFTTTGLSKWCGAGGWRLGAMFLPLEIDRAHKAALIGIASETYSCAPAPVQMAARQAYSSADEIKPYLDAQINILSTVASFCYHELTNVGIRLHPCQGGFYLFPDFSNFQSKLNATGISNSNELCAALMKDTGVALLPGTAFGMAAEVLTCRLAFVDFEDPLRKQRFNFDKDCSNVIQGIYQLVNWLHSL